MAQWFEKRMKRLHEFFAYRKRKGTTIRRIMRELTVPELAKLLRDAEIAHEDYRRTAESADSDWAHWYAEYILSQLPEVRWE